MARKLKINGKIANFDGVKKGTITIGSDTYEFDNAGSEAPNLLTLYDMSPVTQYELTFEIRNNKLIINGTSKGAWNYTMSNSITNRNIGSSSSTTYGFVWKAINAPTGNYIIELSQNRRNYYKGSDGSTIRYSATTSTQGIIKFEMVNQEDYITFDNATFEPYYYNY